MQCPIDQTTLVMSERRGIEIDYCPTCRGVWLDRGELDKLITAEEQSVVPRQREYEDDYKRERYDNRNSDEGYYKKRKKESFLGDLFDF